VIDGAAGKQGKKGVPRREKPDGETGNVLSPLPLPFSPYPPPHFPLPPPPLHSPNPSKRSLPRASPMLGHPACYRSLALVYFSFAPARIATSLSLPSSLSISASVVFATCSAFTGLSSPVSPVPASAASVTLASLPPSAPVPGTRRRPVPMAGSSVVDALSTGAAGISPRPSLPDWPEPAGSADGTATAVG